MLKVESINFTENTNVVLVDPSNKCNATMSTNGMTEELTEMWYLDDTTGRFCSALNHYCFDVIKGIHISRSGALSKI